MKRALRSRGAPRKRLGLRSSAAVRTQPRHADRPARGDGRDVPVPADLEMDSRRRPASESTSTTRRRVGRRHRRRSPPARSTSAHPTRRCPRSAHGVQRASSSRGRSRRPVPYNLPGLSKRLRLDGPTLARIYLGDITNWSDPALRAINPVAQASPTSRSRRSTARTDRGRRTTSPSTFVGQPRVEEQGRRQHVGQLPDGRRRPRELGCRRCRRTPGALTYVDVAYSIRTSSRSRRSRTGPASTQRRVSAGSSRRSRSCRGRCAPLAAEDRRSPDGGRAARLPDRDLHLRDRADVSEKAADLRKFVYWAVTGQKFGPPLLFKPLPVTVQAFAFREIKKIQGASSLSGMTSIEDEDPAAPRKSSSSGAGFRSVTFSSRVSRSGPSVAATRPPRPDRVQGRRAQAWPAIQEFGLSFLWTETGTRSRTCTAP